MANNIKEKFRAIYGKEPTEKELEQYIKNKKKIFVYSEYKDEKEDIPADYKFNRRKI